MDTPDADSWSRTAPATLPFDGLDYVLAFWSITSQDTLSPQREAHVEFGRTASSSHSGAASMGGGQWVVTAKAYYVWNFGVGGGDNALLIDAFDIQLGDFIPDDFVDATPDDGARTLTMDANNGYIDTSTQIAEGNALTVTARDTLRPNKQFGYWQEVPSLTYNNDPTMPATIGAPDNHDIVVHYNDIVVAFAFYNEFDNPIKRPPYYATYNPWWWIETHGGLVPPRGGGDPWVSQYAAALSLASAAERVSSQLRVGILEMALKQLSISAGSLEKEIREGGKKI